MYLYEKIWKQLNPNGYTKEISIEEFRHVLGRELRLSKKDSFFILRELKNLDIADFVPNRPQKISVKSFKSSRKLPFIVEI